MRNAGVSSEAWIRTRLPGFPPLEWRCVRLRKEKWPLLSRRILNVGEPSWWLSPTGILAWAEVRAEDVLVPVSSHLKGSLTVLARVWVDMQKLPLVIRAACKMERVEGSQLGDEDSIYLILDSCT
jgi:hypothetical protein